MTVKERINELLDAARNLDAAAPERAELVEQARRLCREHKIGMGAFDWPDAEIVDTNVRVEETPATAEAPRSIGEMVERLLMDPGLNYAEIASRVRAHFAHARTTNRSVASVAKAMRARGVDVARRRGPPPTPSALRSRSLWTRTRKCRTPPRLDPRDPSSAPNPKFAHIVRRVRPRTSGSKGH